MLRLQEEAWEAGKEQRGVEGVEDLNPHQEEIDLVSRFFEVEQQLQSLAATSDQVPAATICSTFIVGITNTHA